MPNTLTEFVIENYGLQHKDICDITAFDLVEKVYDWNRIPRFVKDDGIRDSQVHVYPETDIEPHQMNSSCWCSPIFGGIHPKTNQLVWNHRIARVMPN